jgi:stalled ribosome rescue protein Dom34
MDAGLWIDHRRAVVVHVSGEEETTTVIDSNVEKHVRYSAGGESNASGPSRSGSGEDTRERHFEGQLNKFYDEVIASIRESDAILILGPGEAKGELRARLVRQGLVGLIVGVEPADKMTDRQIAAKVRALLKR